MKTDNTVAGLKEFCSQKNYSCESLPQPKKLIIQSKSMSDLFRLIVRASRCDASVLILGESGVGKEVVAKELHCLSSRKSKPFIAVNCAALPENLIESELFGHKKGAFTGADTSHQGLVKAANNGTLFLDEIAEMPLALQAKLLRFLQEGTVRPVGSTEEYSVDVRIIAATNKNIEQLILEGKFREDLYFRLNVIPLNIPPLRERRDDLGALLSHFMKMYTIKHNPYVKSISREALNAIIEHNWFGNVRELENTIERAVALCSSEQIQISDLMLTKSNLNNIQINSKIDPETNTENIKPYAFDRDIESSSYKGIRQTTPHEIEIDYTMKPSQYHFKIESPSPLSLYDIEKSYIKFISENTNLSKEELAFLLGINSKTLSRRHKECGLG